MENVPVKITGDTLSATEFNNGVMTELKNAVLSSNQALSGATLDQLAKCIANYSGAGDYYVDSGIADAYVLSPVSPADGPTSLFTGLRVRFMTANANTGASTVNVNGLGVQNIKTPYAIDPSPGDIETSKFIELTYDGANFIITSELPGYSGVVYNNALQSINPSTLTQLLANTVEFDTRSYWDAVNFRFVPKIRGIYRATAHARITGINKDRALRVLLYKNASIEATTDVWFSLDTTTGGPCATQLVSLNGSTDYFEAYVEQTDGSARNILPNKQDNSITLDLVQRTT